MGYPNFPNVPPPMGPAHPQDPGSIPLRPLRLGDLIGGGFGLVRRHAALLMPVAFVIAAISAAADIAILAGSGTLDEIASGKWLDDLSHALSTGSAATLPTGLYLATTVSTLVSMIGGLAVSAIAAAAVSADAVARTGTAQAARRRLAGRVGAGFAVAIVVGVGITVGSFLVIIPGVIAYVVWAAAAPVAVVEGAGLGAALARSARLTRGNRMRILGVTLLIIVITAVIDQIISSIVIQIVPNLSPTASLIVSSGVGAVVSAVTLSWVGGVIALIYMDLRLRGENLAPTLRAYAIRHPQG